MLDHLPATGIGGIETLAGSDAGTGCCAQTFIRSIRQLPGDLAEDPPDRALPIAEELERFACLGPPCLRAGERLEALLQLGEFTRARCERRDLPALETEELQFSQAAALAGLDLLQLAGEDQTTFVDVAITLRLSADAGKGIEQFELP